MPGMPGSSPQEILKLYVFAADHGDGLGFHGNISKGYMEEEAWHVHTIIIPPGRLPKGEQDHAHLSIGVDIGTFRLKFIFGVVKMNYRETSHIKTR